MHHTQKKKFLELKKSGIDPEKLQRLMLDAGIDAVEVEEFIAAPLPDDSKGDQSKEPAKTGATTTKNAGKAPAALDTESANSVYEEWKMSKSFDSKNNIVLEKVKMQRDNIKMDPHRADRLNEHAEARLVKYFPK